MNALFVLRPAKLRAFNFGHPCPSLVKGRWIDGKAQTVALLRFNCDTPALFITKPICRQDGGIATSPLLRTTFLPSLVKGEVLSPEFFRATTGGIVTLPLAPHYPVRFSCCEFDSPTSHKNRPPADAIFLFFVPRLLTKSL